MRRLIAALGQPADRQKKLHQDLDREMKYPPVDPLNLFAAILIPVTAETSEAERRSLGKQEALLAATQVLLYRSRKGAFPLQLSDALARTPTDPMTGDRFEYRREGKGFVIFSRGADGTFDGGLPGTAIPTKQVGFRFPAGKSPPARESAR